MLLILHKSTQLGSEVVTITEIEVSVFNTQ